MRKKKDDKNKKKVSNEHLDAPIDELIKKLIQVS